MPRFVYRRGVEAELERLPAMLAELRREAKEAADASRAMARAEAYDSGDYANGIEGDAGMNERGQVVGRVRGMDWKSGLLEYGDLRHVGAKAILRRGVTSRGLRMSPGKNG